MKCSTCKAEFCWTCLGPWEPHGSSWYHCNRFNESESRDARDTQAVSSPLHSYVVIIITILAAIEIVSGKILILL